MTLSLSFDNRRVPKYLPSKRELRDTIKETTIRKRAEQPLRFIREELKSIIAIDNCINTSGIENNHGPSSITFMPYSEFADKREKESNFSRAVNQLHQRVITPTTYNKTRKFIYK